MGCTLRTFSVVQLSQAVSSSPALHILLSFEASLSPLLKKHSLNHTTCPHFMYFAHSFLLCWHPSSLLILPLSLIPLNNYLQQICSGCPCSVTLLCTFFHFTLSFPNTGLHVEYCFRYSQLAHYRRVGIFLDLNIRSWLIQVKSTFALGSSYVCLKMCS